MSNLTSIPFEYNDDTNQKKLEEIWGDSCKKLTPKQRQLVVEILEYKRAGTENQFLEIWLCQED